MHTPDFEKMDRDTQETIERVGWQVIYLGEWSHTVGLSETVPGAPELVMYGLPPSLLMPTINSVARRLRDGTLPAIADGQTDADVMAGGYVVTYRDVDPSWYGRLFKVSLRRAHHQGLPEPRYVLVAYPDAQHRLPWDPASRYYTQHPRYWLPYSPQSDLDLN